MDNLRGLLGISRDEVSSTFRKLKCGKAAGVDGIIAEVISK